MKSHLLFTACLLASLGGFSHTIHPAIHCLACAPPEGLQANDLTGTSATLSWNAASGAIQ
jgi:hypothetical protein